MATIREQHVVAREGDGTRTTDERYKEKRVVIVTGAVSLQWIARHPLLPRENAPVEDQPGFYWDTVSRKQLSPLAWELDCEASPFSFPSQPDSPLAEPADISVDCDLREEHTLFDHKKRPIVTTAGEWIAGVTREVPTLVYRVAKNLGTDPAWFDTHMGAINSDAVRLRGRTCAPKTLLLRRCSLAPYQTRNRVRYTACTLELSYKADQWIHRIWNRGTLQLIEFKNEKQKKDWRQERILSGNPATPVTEPVPLDAKGVPLEGVLDPNQTTPIDPRKMIILDIQTQIENRFTGVLPLL